MTERPAWLGRQESISLEYKRAEVLRRPERVARPVVGMLNASGGTVVIGVDDEGRPVGIDESQPAADRLHGALLDRIEPRPLGAIEVVQRTVMGVEVLEVNVDAPKDRLFAERRNQMLGFWYRAGSSVLPMTMTEVTNRIQGKADRQNAHLARVKVWRDDLNGVIEGSNRRLAISFLPHSATRRTESQQVNVVKQWRHLPAEESSRRNGFGLGLVQRHSEQKYVNKSLTVTEAGDYRGAVLHSDGRFTAWFGESLLQYGALGGRPTQTVNTWVLLEGVATAARFMRLIIDEWPAPTILEWALLLRLPKGEKILAALPGSIGWDAGWFGRREFDGGLIHLVGETTAEDLRSGDIVAYRMLRSLWGELEFSGDLPLWDEHKSRFMFPTG